MAQNEHADPIYSDRAPAFSRRNGNGFLRELTSTRSTDKMEGIEIVKKQKRGTMSDSKSDGSRGGENEADMEEETEMNFPGSEEMELGISHIHDKVEQFNQLVSELLENGKSLFNKLSNEFEERILMIHREQIEKWQEEIKELRMLDSCNEEMNTCLQNAQCVLQSSLQMDQGGQAELIAQMKSSVQTLGSSAQNYENTMLMRFLVARSMEPEKAAKMFVGWQKWRTDIAPLGFIADSEVPDQLEARKVYLGGQTKDGHPLAVIKLSNHYPSKDQLQFKKFVVHGLDKIIASAREGTKVGSEKMIAIIDLQEISIRNVDARGLITGFQYLQAYYPERLKRCFILHMPRFFVSVWKLISRFLDKETLQKITIVSNEEEMKSFIEQIGRDALPECYGYGGKAKLVALQDVVLPLTP
ncbi:hypothetical protein V2J09_012682 [Rumex salicifolius]